MYQKTNSILIISSRDLVLAHHVAKVTHPTLCPNGGFLIVSFTPTPTIDHLQPITKAAIRANVILGAWLLEPIGEKQTRATLLVEIDMMGLAEFAVKKALKMQGNQFTPLKTVIQKFLNQNPDCPWK